MKRSLPILLAVIMVFGMFVPVSADTSMTEDLKAELVAIINKLPEKYTKETGKAAAEAKSIMDRLVEDGVTEDYIKTLTDNYGRYESHIALYSEWLSAKRTQDRVLINWTKEDSTHAADIFEFDSAEIDKMPDKQGIVMKTENVLLPSNYTSGSHIGFYSTDSAKKTYNGTFPDKFNEYYITNGELTYGYSGISETIGQNTYNAGMISQTYGFDIPFDGVTPYDKISILANSITYLGGETARQLPAIKTKVYFADGTTKEETSIVGNFGYGYRIALYSMLKNDTMPYSERMSQRIKDNLDDMWYPTDVNVSKYFELTDKSIRLYYSNGAKAIKAASAFGRASTINVDTDGKAVEKVSVTYATASDLQKIGGQSYDFYITQTTSGTVINSEKKSANTYYIPINKEQLKDVTGYDANRDYYIAAIISDLYPVYLHGVTGVRTNESSYAEEIAEIEREIEGFSNVFDGTEFNDMKDVERRIIFLENQGVSRASFDSTLLEKLEYLLGGIVNDNGHYEIYVSPNGDDNGYGSKAVPVQTLERAKAIARTYENDKPIDIILLEGEHNLTKTFELSDQDSGTEENPVTIKGAGGVITTADTLSYSDFEKVTEEEAGEKLQPKVIGNVLKLDLSKAGIDATDMPVFSSIYVRGDGYEDVTFFVNDKEQNVAQYPNGESNYDTWVDLADTSISSGKIKVNANRAKKWQNEKFAYFEGYPAPDYSNERNNITIKGDLICFKNAARFNLDEVHSRRYKVKHLLYELDAPGEWYIDRDKNILYYYPTSDFDENAKIQIAARKLNAITTSSGLSNLYFDGVKFDKIRGDAIVAGSSNENVNVYNCEFTNISNIAVSYTASKNAPTLGEYVSNYTDAAKNCEIRNNRFINIGCNAIRFIGGNRSTLSDGNNVIANNYIYNASDKQRCNAVISVSGAFNYVLNNEIHMGTFHAINFSGNENVIAHNELYNMIRDTGDCGVIYNGRHLATRGNEIAYNYIHDYKHLDKRTKDGGVGVYLDNRLSGTNIHHNILFANGIGESTSGIQNGGGQHNIVNHNTIIDTDASITRTNRFVEDYVNNSESTAFDEIIRISGMPANETVILDNGYEKSYEMLGKNQLYFEKYPEMNESIATLLNPEETVPKFVSDYPFILTLPEFSEGGKYGNLSEAIKTGKNLKKYRLLSLKSTIGNEYVGNIANSPWRAMKNKDVDGNVYDVYKEFGGKFEDNVEDASKAMFVDYENKDFRIKGSTNGGALDESFDMNKIGIQADGSVSYNLNFDLNDIETINPKEGIDKSFKVTYVDGSDKANVFLMWERPVSSDYFTVEIATDANMNNIIKSEEAYFSRLSVDLTARSEDTFYFRVTARNIGRKGSQWENSDGVKTIKTLYSVSLDIYKDATVPFDITESFNADLFSNEGEIVKSSNLTIGTYSGDMGMYNLTKFKSLVPSNGYYEYKDTVFHFPQVGYVSDSKNAIKTTNGSTTTLSLKNEEKGNYDEVKLVMSSKYPAKDYEIIACYEDNTTDTFKVALHQYYSTYHSYETADVVMSVDGVNGEGKVISTLSTSNLNKLYQTVIDTDENKVLTELKFVGGSGTVYNGNKNEEFIFAITGVQGDRTLENGNTMKVISMKNYSGAEITANVIITGYVDGKFTSVIIPTTIKNNIHSGVLNIEIPEKVEEMTNRAMFIWNRDFDVMKAFSEKLPLK